MFLDLPFVVFSAAIAFAVVGGASAFLAFEQRAARLVRWVRGSTRKRPRRPSLVPALPVDDEERLVRSRFGERGTPALVGLSLLRPGTRNEAAHLFDRRAESKRSGTFESLEGSDRWERPRSDETLDSSPKRFVRAGERRDLLDRVAAESSGIRETSPSVPRWDDEEAIDSGLREKGVFPGIERRRRGGDAG